MNILQSDRVIVSKLPITEIRPINTTQTPSPKPKGLWYGIGYSWINWVKTEMPEWMGMYIYKIELNPATILRISTVEMLDEFNKTYAEESRSFPGFYLDWNLVTTKYSGIEISPYQWSRRMKYMWYYGWDVASGCIWNHNVVSNLTQIK